MELAYNAAKVEKDAKEIKCYPCKCLVTDLEKGHCRNFNEEVEETTTSFLMSKVMQREPCQLNNGLT